MKMNTLKKDNKGMKNHLYFILGFITCFVVGILMQYLPSLVYADSNKEIYEFTKANYPVYSNGIKTEIDVFGYNGNTYLKIVDLKNYLYGIDISWDDKNRRVNIDNIFEPNTIEYNNTQYYELPKILYRYISSNISKEQPYITYIERDMNRLNLETSIRCFVYMGNEHRFTADKIEYDEIHFEGIILDNKVYILNSEYYDNLSKLTQMIVENEKYFKLHPELIK